MPHYKKLTGEKVYLSPCAVEDVPTFTKWMNDSQITDGWGNTYGFINEEKMDSRLKNNQATEYCFSIVKNEGDKLIGYCIIYEYDKICRSASCGILIGEIDEQKKGFGGDALKLMIKFAFESLNLHSLNLGVFDFNIAALSIYEKAGFKKIGNKRQNYYLNGKWHDEILMDLLDVEYFKKTSND